MCRSRARDAFTFTIVVVTLAAGAQTAAAQATTPPSTTPTASATGRFSAGYTDIGPAIGLGNTGTAGAYVPIGVTANYHFKLEDPRFDPFLGAGLGYSIVTCRLTGPATITNCPYASAFYPIARVGGRYFFSPKMAMYADAGAGAATLSIGLMFKMK